MHALQSTVAAGDATRAQAGPGRDHGELGFQFTAMASACEIRVAGMSRRKAQPLVQRAIDEVRRIEAKFSRYRASSVVSRLNARAGSGVALAVDAETCDLLDFADSLHAASDGLFDATSGILRRAWDFQAQCLPAPGQIEALLPRIGWQHVRRRGRAVELRLPGMELDFGGFGKEYAADRAATLLQGLGVRHGLVNLGGDIRAIGPRPDGSPWLLGIAHPRQHGAVVGEVGVGLGGSAGALATSGDYERFMVIDGQRHCHILDPRTGWPVRHWQSVSVVAPVCLAAGALATVAMLKGAEALAWLDAQEVGYLAVDALGQAHRNTTNNGSEQ